MALSASPSEVYCCNIGDEMSKVYTNKTNQNDLTSEQNAWVEEHADQLDDMDCRPDFGRPTGIEIPSRIKREIQKMKNR